MQELSAIAIAAALFAHFYEWLKQSRYVPWLKVEAATVHRVMAWLAAFVAGLGISWTYDGAHGALTVTGLTLAGMSQKLGHIGASWLAQKTYYRMVIAPPSDPKAVALLQDIAADLAKGAKS